MNTENKWATLDADTPTLGDALATISHLRSRFNLAGTEFTPDDVTSMVEENLSLHSDATGRLADTYTAQIAATVMGDYRWDKIADRLAEIGNTVIADLVDTYTAAIEGTDTPLMLRAQMEDVDGRTVCVEGLGQCPAAMIEWLTPHLGKFAPEIGQFSSAAVIDNDGHPVVDPVSPILRSFVITVSGLGDVYLVLESPQVA